MRRKTHEEFIIEVFELVGDEFTVLERYKTTMTKILLKHNECNHEFLCSPDAFLRGSRCPHCANRKRSEKYRLSYEEVVKYLDNINYELISKEYKNTKSKIIVKCPEGHICETTLGNIKKNGSGCKICGNIKIGNKRRTPYEEVKSYIESFDGFKLLTETYLNSSEKLDIQCPKGHIFSITFSQFKYRGDRCRFCNESHGESAIDNYLIKNSIEFIREYKINDCRNVYPLPFDFAIFDGDNLTMLIEFQGEQHFNALGYFGGIEKLERTQHNDNIKREYCKLNNLKLLEIPYYKLDEVDSILDKEFSF